MKRKRGEEATAGSPLIVKRQKLLASRQNLPIWKRRRDIQDAIRDHDVLVLSGETGSGKSTQVPQFITDVFKNGKIAVTQPRRVAAISLVCRGLTLINLRILADHHDKGSRTHCVALSC